MSDHSKENLHKFRAAVHTINFTTRIVKVKNMIKDISQNENIKKIAIPDSLKYLKQNENPSINLDQLIKDLLIIIDDLPSDADAVKHLLALLSKYGVELTKKQIIDFTEYYNKIKSKVVNGGRKDMNAEAEEAVNAAKEEIRKAAEEEEEWKQEQKRKAEEKRRKESLTPEEAEAEAKAKAKAAAEAAEAARVAEIKTACLVAAGCVAILPLCAAAGIVMGVAALMEGQGAGNISFRERCEKYNRYKFKN